MLLLQWATASLFAAGVAVLHVATVFYFAPKLARAPTLYGSLGTAATLLVWLFVISRIVVASAFLNATLWRRNAATGQSAATGASSSRSATVQTPAAS